MPAGQYFDPGHNSKNLTAAQIAQQPLNTGNAASWVPASIQTQLNANAQAAAQNYMSGSDEALAGANVLNSVNGMTDSSFGQSQVNDVNNAVTQAQTLANQMKANPNNPYLINKLQQTQLPGAAIVGNYSSLNNPNATTNSSSPVSLAAFFGQSPTIQTLLGNAGQGQTQQAFGGMTQSQTPLNQNNVGV